jgi:hypothetical protein
MARGRLEPSSCVQVRVKDTTGMLNMANAAIQQAEKREKESCQERDSQAAQISTLQVCD